MSRSDEKKREETFVYHIILIIYESIFISNVSIPGQITWTIIIHSNLPFIRSEDSYGSVKRILTSLREMNELTDSNAEEIQTEIEKNLKWLKKNLEGIISYLDGDTSQPTSPDPTDTTEITTLSSSSVVASLTVIVACVFIKQLL